MQNVPFILVYHFLYRHTIKHSEAVSSQVRCCSCQFGIYLEFTVAFSLTTVKDLSFLEVHAVFEWNATFDKDLKSAFARNYFIQWHMTSSKSNVNPENSCLPEGYLLNSFSCPPWFLLHYRQWLLKAVSAALIMRFVSLVPVTWC